MPRGSSRAGSHSRASSRYGDDACSELSAESALEAVDRVASRLEVRGRACSLEGLVWGVGVLGFRVWGFGVWGSGFGV